MHHLKNVFRARTSGTSQLVPQQDRTQVQNSARGFVYALDPMDRIERFLVLGSEGGTYYAAERALTQENALHLATMVRTNGLAVVERIVALSTAGRAPKVSPAIFALAMCAGFGDDATRRAALGPALRAVCRTGSHLLEFASYVEQFRGWGRRSGAKRNQGCGGAGTLRRRGFSRALARCFRNQEGSLADHDAAQALRRFAIAAIDGALVDAAFVAAARLRVTARETEFAQGIDVIGDGRQTERKHALDVGWGVYGRSGRVHGMSPYLTYKRAKR